MASVFLIVCWALIFASAAGTPARDPSFPPSDVLADPDKLASWFLAHPPLITPQPGLTARESTLIRWTATEYIEERRHGRVTCVEYVQTLFQRARFYADMNIFMKTTLKTGEATVVSMARRLDELAAEKGVDAIGPLYGLPVPVKGTMATTDFASSAGNEALDGFVAVKDAAMVKLLKRANGIPFGKTNVPDFAGSWITINPVNGRTMNPYGPLLTSGGSSGGSAAAVSFYISPLAITEDTGGSTRHPAYQNQNFGYDPSSHHFPNQGNPSISWYNDQVGLNARSFDDILLVDAALLGTTDAHRQAQQTEQLSSSPSGNGDGSSDGDVRVGFPQFPFVTLELPADAYNFWGLRNYTVSPNIRAKYDAVRQALAGTAGFGVVDGEWPDVSDSAFFKRKVNSALDTLFGNRRINNRDYDGMGSGTLLSYTGAVAEWVSDYLDADVSLKTIKDSLVPVGQGHNVAGFMAFSTDADISQGRYHALAQREKLQVFNSYFDHHNVDMIMVPGQICDAITYHGMANSQLPLHVRSPDGGDAYTALPASLIECNLLAYFAFKDIPVPKVWVPVGLDSSGNPVSVGFLGRGVPLDKLYDEAYARTHDIAFLHKVKRIVDELAANHPDLNRADAPAVTANLASDRDEL